MIAALLLGAVTPILLLLLWIGFAKLPLVMTLLLVLFLVMAAAAPARPRRRPGPDDPASIIAAANAAANAAAARERTRQPPPAQRPAPVHPCTPTPAPPRCHRASATSCRWRCAGGRRAIVSGRRRRRPMANSGNSKRWPGFSPGSAATVQRHAMSDLIRPHVRPRVRLRVRWALLVAAMTAGMAAVPAPAAAQSILRDAETEALLKDMSRPLIKAAGLDERSVQIILVGDASINAFAGGGQNVFIHSGLIINADNANMLQGVIAHELGHIAGGHNVRFGEGAGPATKISLLSLLAAAGAVAAGAGEAGMAILGLGQTVAQGRFLSFTREQESRTDQAGARYLGLAGLSGKGSIGFFEKLQGNEFRLGVPQIEYVRTHPLSSTRIANLESIYTADPAWDRPTDPALEARFQRVRGKLVGYVSEPAQVFQTYPESNGTVPARYARAYAWHRSAYPDQAIAEADRLLASAPQDAYFLELKGQILLESGRVEEAIPVLREAVRFAPDQPLVMTLLGHALIAREDSANFGEAEPLLKTAIARDKDNPFAWYQLGVIYDRRGDGPRAALAAAERFTLENNPQGAMANARLALNGLPRGTPDWLRADDIVLLAGDALDRKGRRRR